MFRRPALVLLAIVLVSLALMTYQSASGPIKLFSFIPALAARLDSFVQDALQTFDQGLDVLRDREARYDSLQRELDELRPYKHRYLELRSEVRRMRSLMGITAEEYRKVAYARVLARGFQRWSDTFIIDKGAKDSVHVDMAAITPEGLCGKVINVSDTYSVVLLVEDVRLSAAVRTERGRKEGVFTGGGLGSPGTLKYVGVDLPVEVGEAVLTSGLDALYPPGIPVGMVEEVVTDEKELFHHVTVTPFVDTTKVEEVLIVTR